jgi:hypothetical protein
MNSLIDHLRFRQVDCYCIVDSIMVQAEFAFSSLTDMDISELYDVKKTATTTTLSDPEVSVVKEASCKPDLPRHSPRLTLLYKQPYKPLWLRVLPDTSIVPITPSRVTK